MNSEGRRLERAKLLKRMGIALVLLGIGFNLAAYFFFPKPDQEPFYMTSLVFFAMAAYCLFSKPS